MTFGPVPAYQVPTWIAADRLLRLVGITGTPTAAQQERAGLVVAQVNVGIARVLDRPDPAFDPVVLAGWPDLEAAAATAAQYAYRRFDTAFDTVGYADLTGAAIKVARDALAYVAPQLERWRRVGGIG
jgi:hypothetical protein